MRQLTEAENEAMEAARGDFGGRGATIEGKAARFGFRRGWIACLDYQQARIEELEAQKAALLEACEMAYEDLEQYEYTDLPGGYAVMETVQVLRDARAKATGAQAGEGE